MKKYVLLLGSLAAAVALAAGPAGDGSGLRYNEVQWKASHNSYAKPTPIRVQLEDWNIFSIEFDLHTVKKTLGRVRDEAPAGDFLVYHNARDDFSNCGRLSECLAEVRGFAESRPDRGVITIFFDMEGVGEAGHAKSDLYNVFKNSLPPGSIFTPGDLMAACPGAKTLQESVTREGCGWPRLADLAGKFILVVSDGRDDIKAAGYDLTSDLLFLVSKSSSASRLTSDPDVVFFNMSGPDVFARAVHDHGFVSRCYWLDSEDKYHKARQNGCNHLATDLVDVDRYPWSATAREDGTPYAVIAP